MTKFKTPELIAEYVKSGILYHGEIPFLYRVFKSTDVPSTKERGGYKVVSVPLLLIEHPSCSPRCQVRHGSFQNPAILDTMLIYFGKRGVGQYLPTLSAQGRNPIGMLALISTAVCSTFSKLLISNITYTGGTCTPHALHWVFR